MRSLEAMKNASIETIIAMVAALGASMAGGSGAPMIAAAGVGQRAFISFSVAQEATADHAALNYLDRTGQSARGLLKFFEILKPTSRRPAADRPGAYPPADCRIEYLRHRRDRAVSTRDTPQSVARAHQVKLHAFPTTRPRLARYPESDLSPDARLPAPSHRIPKLDGVAGGRRADRISQNPYSASSRARCCSRTAACATRSRRTRRP